MGWFFHVIDGDCNCCVHRWKPFLVSQRNFTSNKSSTEHWLMKDLRRVCYGEQAYAYIRVRNIRIDTYWKSINIHAYLWFFYRSLGWRSGIVWTSILHDRNSDAYSRLNYISYPSSSIINPKQWGCLWRADNCWKMYSCLTSRQFTSGQRNNRDPCLENGRFLSLWRPTKEITLSCI